MRLKTEITLLVGIALGSFGSQIANSFVSQADACQMAGPPQMLSAADNAKLAEIVAVMDTMRLPIARSAGVEHGDEIGALIGGLK